MCVHIQHLPTIVEDSQRRLLLKRGLRLERRRARHVHVFIHDYRGTVSFRRSLTGLGRARGGVGVLCECPGAEKGVQVGWWMAVGGKAGSVLDGGVL